MTSSPYLPKAAFCPSGSKASGGMITRDTPEVAQRLDLVEGAGAEGAVAAGGDLDGVGVAAVLLGGLAHDVDQLGELLVGAAAGEEAVADAAGAAGGGLGVAADVDREVGLGGAGAGVGVGERGELAVVRRLALVPELAEHGDVVVGPLAALGERDADGVELLLEPADADAELDPSLGEVVEGGDLLGDEDRVALREDQDAGAEADRAGGGRHEG